MEFDPTIFPLSSKCHRNSVQPPFRFRPNTIGVWSIHLPSFVQMSSKFGPTIFPLSSKCHRSSIQPSSLFRTNAIEIRSIHLSTFVQMPSKFAPTTFPLPSKCHRSSVQSPFRFHANAGEQFFRFCWIILLMPFGCSSNSLATLLLISFLILLRLFRLLSLAEGRWGGGARGAVKQADERCGKGALFYWHHKNKGRNGIVRPCVDGSVAGSLGSAISSS